MSKLRDPNSKRNTKRHPIEVELDPEACRRRAIMLSNELFRLGNAVLESGPHQADAKRMIDAAWSSVKRWAPARFARMYLLEQLARVDYVDEVTSTMDALSKKIVGARLTAAEERTAAVKDTPAWNRASGFLLVHSSVAGTLAAKAPYDPIWGLRAAFANEFPEYARHLTDEDIKTALAIWRARGRPRRVTTLPKKWPFLAETMRKIGLGEITWKSLQTDWGNWSSAKTPGG